MATKSNYKNKPFNEWTEEDFQQHQADLLASYEKMSEDAEREIAERVAAEKKEA